MTQSKVRFRLDFSRLAFLLPILRWVPEMNRYTVRSDLMAGIVGAVVVLPQGVAFATIAGMPPQYGLYAAMIPAIVAAVFGSSRLLVSGPTTAASVVLFSSLSQFAEPGTMEYVKFALTLTFLVGMVQFLMGLARLGNLVNFISHSVIAGFTTGAAVLIIISQAKFFFGLDIERGLATHEVIYAVVTSWEKFHLGALLVGMVTLLVAVLTKRFLKRFPYMIVGLVMGGVVAFLINTFAPEIYHVDLVGSISAGLPPLSSPDFSLQTLQSLAPAIFAVTIFALTEAVSIARSLSTRTGDLLDGNQEFIGQGLSNIIGSFFSSYVATGSFNRSGVNYEAGARTPLAAIFAALALMLIVVAIAPLIAYIPKTAMAALLFLVAVGIVEVGFIKKILSSSLNESLVLVTTFLSTLIFKLDFAILLGVFLSLIMYLRRASKPLVRVRTPDPSEPRRRLTTDPRLPECPQFKLIRIDGPIFFGAVDYVTERLHQIANQYPDQKHLLILARPISFIDVAGAELLIREARIRRGIGGGMYFHQLPEEAHLMLRRLGYEQEIGVGNFYFGKQEAIAGIFAQLDRKICLNCKARIFGECRSLPSRAVRPKSTLAAPPAIPKGVAVENSAVANIEENQSTKQVADNIISINKGKA